MEIAREALAAGYVVGMPVERSGADKFEFVYGDAFGDHIAASRSRRQGRVRRILEILRSEFENALLLSASRRLR